MVSRCTILKGWRIKYTYYLKQNRLRSVINAERREKNTFPFLATMWFISIVVKREWCEMFYYRCNTKHYQREVCIDYSFILASFLRWCAMCTEERMKFKCSWLFQCQAYVESVSQSSHNTTRCVRHYWLQNFTHFSRRWWRKPCIGRYS